MGKAALLIILMMGIFLFLYNSGYMVFKSMRSVSFVGSMKGNHAKFTSCTGYIKRIVRFRTDGTYTYVLDADLGKGDMSVELLDSAKQKMMQLNCDNPSACITVEKKKKYYLVISFKSATGRYTLTKM